MWQKLWAWCRKSATIAVARGQILAGALLEILNQAVILISSANAAQFLPPRWLAIYMLTSGIITELARRRTLAD